MIDPCVCVKFDDRDNWYTYFTHIPDLQRGDLVVVEKALGGFAVVEVVSPDPAPHLRENVTKWIVDKVDLDKYRALTALDPPPRARRFLSGRLTKNQRKETDMSITKNAMVLNLQIGIWQGYRLDRDASQKVTLDANADGDAARVNKHLVPKDALKAVVSAAGAVRNHFYAKTLPWKDNGDRLITRLMFIDFIQEHGTLHDKFKAAVEEFLTTGYPSARDRAEFRMGDLFKSDDYPSADSLRRKFYINLDIDAVTEAGDFRVEMGDDEVASIRQGMEEAMRGRLGKAMADVWTRLADVVGNFADKMKDPDAIFRDSTVRNMEEVLELLPGLNILDDPDLETMREDVKARLAGYDPKDLRKDKAVRAEAAEQAAEIMDRMRGFMTAFTVGEA